MIADTIATLARLTSGTTVRYSGRAPAPGPRVYFANHGSHLDFVVLWSCLPRALRPRTRPVAAADYWERSSIRRRIARLFNPVLIDRRASDRRANALEAMAGALGAGDSLILFPEGTRGRDGEVSRFRGGLYGLARRRPDVELVPVSIDGLDRVLPKGAWLPAPLPSTVTFGPPLQLRPGEGQGAFLERARAAVLELRG
jgi:1-acyl-sn-glycerol-3-phosphate acyltransferase